MRDHPFDARDRPGSHPGKWAAATFPDTPGVDLRIALEVDGRDVTVVELRPPRGDKDSPSGSRNRSPGLTYVTSRKAWNLTIPTWDGHNRRYRPLPTGPLDHLLTEIHNDPTFIIWG